MAWKKFACLLLQSRSTVKRRKEKQEEKNKEEARFLKTVGISTFPPVHKASYYRIHKT
jgi:hypothetical protein